MPNFCSIVFSHEISLKFFHYLQILQTKISHALEKYAGTCATYSQYGNKNFSKLIELIFRDK